MTDHVLTANGMGYFWCSCNPGRAHVLWSLNEHLAEITAPAAPLTGAGEGHDEPTPVRAAPSGEVEAFVYSVDLATGEFSTRPISAPAAPLAGAGEGHDEGLRHGDHAYAPGRDMDHPDTRDPRWCNTCGEALTSVLPLAAAPVAAPTEEREAREALEGLLADLAKILHLTYHDDMPDDVAARITARIITAKRHLDTLAAALSPVPSDPQEKP